MKNKKLIAYAQDFVSFLIERTTVNKIRRIILFGSVSRSEASKDSDIDLLIDGTLLEKEVKSTLAEFNGSKRYKGYWKLKGIKNEIKPIVGKLDEWKDIKNSIISNGIILYGKFESMPEGGVHKTLYSFENIKPESKRVLLSKRLFGYKKGNKSYEGLLQKQKGERLGKGIVAIPAHSEKEFISLFRDMKITYKIKKIIEYS